MQKMILFIVLNFLLLSSAIIQAADKSTSSTQSSPYPTFGMSPEWVGMEREDREKKEKARGDYNTSVSAYSACLSKNKYVGSKCLNEFRAKMEAEGVAKQYGISTESAYESVCDSRYEDYKTEFKDCRPAYENMKEKCTAKSDSGIIDDSTLQAAAPLMNMLSGADAILDVYGAMNENPQCTASREDFKQDRDSMKTEQKDIEDKISEKTEKMQEAQEDYAKQLNEWADREREILDDIAKIPREKEKNKRKLNEQKVKAKIEADSKYNAVNDQINTLTAEYNSIIQDQKAALYQASDFAMYDTCNGEYEKRAKAAGTVPTANGLSGAYYSGNLKKSDKVNYMANCLKIQRQNAKRVETAFINKLNSIKQKLESYDRMKGQIEEEKKLADEAVNNELKDLEWDAEAEATKLRNEYQGIQTKKLQEQALLNQKLKSLQQDIANLTRKASVLKMKLQAYSSRSIPKNSEKSVESLIEACSGFDNFKDEFSSICCTGAYMGSGKTLCSSFKTREGLDPKGKGKAKQGK